MGFNKGKKMTGGIDLILGEREPILVIALLPKR